MKKRSKRYNKDVKLVEHGKKYALDVAVSILKKFTATKFDQTVNCAMKLGVDVKKSDQLLRGSVALPKGIGKSRKVIVFAEGADADAAKGAGADEVGSEELAAKITGGWLDFDVALALPYMMKKISKLGKVLGPQGKMPSPKSGTVTENIAQGVREFKAGKIEFRTDAGGNVHAPVGKLSFSAADLKANIEAFIDHIRAVKPPSAKGIFLQRVVVSGTMTPGIHLEVV